MDLDSALSDKPAAEGATATDLLRADHTEVRELFEEFANVRDDAHAARVVAQTICMKLELHDAIEREVFYPAVREHDPDLVSRSEHVHADLARALASLTDLADGEQPLDEALSQVRSLLEPHIAEEEQRLFPQLERQAAESLRELGRKLIKRKEELTGSAESLENPAT